MGGVGVLGLGGFGVFGVVGSTVVSDGGARLVVVVAVGGDDLLAAWCVTMAVARAGAYLNPIRYSVPVLIDRNRGRDDLCFVPEHVAD